jgi:hypothetical protein
VFVFCGIEQVSKVYLDSIEFLDLKERENQRWENFEVKYGINQAWSSISKR